MGPRILRASSLSLAMGLTTILTTIWVVHRNTPKCKILIFKENWTSGDLLGHAADVWGSKSHEFLSCPAATTMILPITDDLVRCRDRTRSPQARRRIVETPGPGVGSGHELSLRRRALEQLVTVTSLGQWQVLGRSWSRSVSLWSRSPQIQSCAGRRLRDHYGMRGRLSDLLRAPLHGLASGRPYRTTLGGRTPHP